MKEGNKLVLEMAIFFLIVFVIFGMIVVDSKTDIVKNKIATIQTNR